MSQPAGPDKPAPAPGPLPLALGTRVRVGDLLVQQGAITQEQLDKALKAQKTSPRSSLRGATARDDRNDRPIGVMGSTILGLVAGNRHQVLSLSKPNQRRFP